MAALAEPGATACRVDLDRYSGATYGLYLSYLLQSSLPSGNRRLDIRLACAQPLFCSLSLWPDCNSSPPLPYRPFSNGDREQRAAELGAVDLTTR